MQTEATRSSATSKHLFVTRAFRNVIPNGNNLPHQDPSGDFHFTTTATRTTTATIIIATRTTAAATTTVFDEN